MELNNDSIELYPKKILTCLLCVTEWAPKKLSRSFIALGKRLF